MDITLSIDEETLARARAFAAQRRMTLEELLAEQLRQATAREEAIRSFERRALEQPGRSAPGWRFDRDACHDRGQ